jgi:predicted AAA+ superfamily ATPase
MHAAHRQPVRDDEEEVAVRPEIQSTVDEIQQVIGLLRRHL